MGLEQNVSDCEVRICSNLTRMNTAKTLVLITSYKDKF